MEKCYITKFGNVFRTFRSEVCKEQPENMWLEIGIECFDGIISVQIIDDRRKYFYEKEKFHLDSFCSGSYYHEFGYGKIFKLGLNIKQPSGKGHPLIVTGGDFTNSFGGSSIARYICRFLNKLYQYDNIEDYLASKEVCDGAEWKSKEISDKVVSLAKVIALYHKYKSINPTLQIVQEMEKTIENRLNTMIKNE